MIYTIFYQDNIIVYLKIIYKYKNILIIIFKRDGVRAAAGRCLETRYGDQTSCRCCSSSRWAAARAQWWPCSRTARTRPPGRSRRRSGCWRSWQRRWPTWRWRGRWTPAAWRWGRARTVLQVKLLAWLAVQKKKLLACAAGAPARRWRSRRDPSNIFNIFSFCKKINIFQFLRYPFYWKAKI
jgi:hypothetical protein